MASYVEGALIAGEKILHHGRVSWWAVWHLLLAGVVLLIGVVGMVFLIWGWNLLLAGVVLLVGVVGIVFLIWAWIRVKSTELAITNKRVIAKFGFISRNTMEIAIQKVESIQVRQTLVGRMLDFGTLIVSGTGTSHAPIPSISNPMAFRRAFLEAQEGAIKN
jgi:uncharacterized membrane protein YdbT with pleckstrin-like domain